MKLKKIVSLALAGIMAVSMLTACGDSTTNNGGEVPPQTSGNSALAATLNDEVDLDKIQFATSTELDNALKAAVGLVGNGTLASIYDSNEFGAVAYVDSNSGSNRAVLVSVADDLIDTLESENLGNEGNVSGAMGKLSPATNPDDDDINVTVLYVVNNGVNIDNVLAGVASDMANALNGLELDNADNTQRYAYSGAVSSCNKVATEDHGKGLTFIAVQVTRSLA